MSHNYITTDHITQASIDRSELERLLRILWGLKNTATILEGFDSMDAKKLTNKELRNELNYGNVLLSQDLHDFKCEGTTSPKYSTASLAGFNRKLKAVCDLQRELTKRRQAGSIEL